MLFQYISVYDRIGHRKLLLIQQYKYPEIDSHGTYNHVSLKSAYFTYSVLLQQVHSSEWKLLQLYD